LRSHEKSHTGSGRGFLFPYIRRSQASEEKGTGAQHQQSSIPSREFISDLAA